MDVSEGCFKYGPQTAHSADGREYHRALSPVRAAGSETSGAEEDERASAAVQ